MGTDGDHRERASNSRGLAVDVVRERFRDHGLRCTRQREVLYAALAATKAHPTADELLELVRPTLDGAEGISLATVYNTLDALAAAGLVRRLPSRQASGPCRFDADVGPHVHLSTADGRVIDLPAELSDRVMAALPEGLLDEVERACGVRVGGVHVELLGEARSAE